MAVTRILNRSPTLPTVPVLQLLESSEIGYTKGCTTALEAESALQLVNTVYTDLQSATIHSPVPEDYISG